MSDIKYDHQLLNVFFGINPLLSQRKDTLKPTVDVIGYTSLL